MHRILIVEDDPIVHKAFKLALKSEGFDVLSCLSGGPAQEKATLEKPDLVILDIHLPDISGFEVCKRLKASAETRDIPVLILTGEARQMDDRIAGLDIGAEDYLFKPVSARVLVSRVRSLLRISQQPS